MKRIVYLVISILLILISANAGATVFTPPGATGLTKEDIGYADSVWPSITWRIEEVKEDSNVTLNLPRLKRPYTWAISMDTSREYIGTRVAWKEFYSGIGGPENTVRLASPAETGIYVELLNTSSQVIVASETYVYSPDTGIKYVPPVERVRGAIDEQGKMTGLYDVWGQPIDESVYSPTVFPGQFVVFGDVPEKHWADKTIYQLATAGYINGYPDRTFKPEKNITRAEFAVLMSNLLQDKYPEGFNEDNKVLYNDLRPLSWAYEKSNKLFGYMSGEETSLVFGKSFLPDQKITREEVATVVYYALSEKNGFSDASASIKPFSDLNKARITEGIRFCANTGVILGYPNGSYRPNGNITRAEITALVSKVLIRL